MNWNKKIVVFVGLVLMVGLSMAQKTNTGLVVFTERDYCISGDTLRFQVWVPSELHNLGNIIHVQLDSPNGNLITKVAVKSENGNAKGYIAVPDSLGTGLYFCSAFLNAQRKNSSIPVTGKSLFVYNRFEELINRMPVLKNEQNQTLKPVDVVKIELEKSEYQSREMVKAILTTDEEKIAHASVSVRAVDPFVSKYGGFVQYQLDDANPEIPTLIENDGILLSGKVEADVEKVAGNELILLSVSNVEGYFDYCLSDNKGNFNFFLKNAQGQADIILQTLPSETEFQIEPKLNYLRRNQKPELDTVFLLPNQVQFVENGLKGNFFSRLFNPMSIKVNSFFDMPNPYGIPVYGSEHSRIEPDLFFDLPDFKEISRELLHGVQFRNRADETTFRILNEDQGAFFKNEPLKLLNGVPVFKNSQFSDLKSTDIEYIDIIKSERLYGDLIFKGVLAVSLYDKSNNWLAEQSNVFQFKIDCLQVDKERVRVTKATKEESIPDMRLQYHWSELLLKDKSDLEFVLSDFEGQVEIVVEGITRNNELFKTSKTITVK